MQATWKGEKTLKRHRRRSLAAGFQAASFRDSVAMSLPQLRRLERLQKGPEVFESSAGSFSALKRIMDIAIALVALTFLAPLLAIVAILIKLDSRGPVIFKQRRCGEGGREFEMYKFRTMVEDAEIRKAELLQKNEMDGPIFKIKKDPRVTRVGRWLRRLSLDETLQLINVLKGDMSLVGPRPLAREELEGDPLWRRTRLMVKPGITGAWQVHDRCTGNFDTMVKWDLFYVHHQSFFLDLLILLKTPKAVVSGRGAY